MIKYYATATNVKGKQFRLYDALTFTSRLAARIEAEHLCKIQGLTLDGVYLSGQGKNQGGTLTKFAQYRKQHKTDQNPKNYDKAL
jgi:hypothetical protein